MSTELQELRKKLLYRSAYTGTKETDLLLGKFARTHLANLTMEQLTTYETLLKIEDPRLYKWITKMENVPLEYQSDVLDLLQQFSFTE